jgi:hypothetical protein
VDGDCALPVVDGRAYTKGHDCFRGTTTSRTQTGTPQGRDQQQQRLQADV